MGEVVDDEAEQWLAQARADLSDAEFCRHGGRHNLACFLAQQAAEKAVKAFLLLDADNDPQGWSLRQLCRQAAKVDAAFDALAEEAAPLDEFYLRTRYPSGPAGAIPSEVYDATDSAWAIGLARRVLDAVIACWPGALASQPLA